MIWWKRGKHISLLVCEDDDGQRKEIVSYLRQKLRQPTILEAGSEAEARKQLARIVSDHGSLHGAVVDQRLHWGDPGAAPPGDPEAAGSRLVKYAREIGLENTSVVLYSTFALPVSSSLGARVETLTKTSGSDHAILLIKLRGLLSAEAVSLPPLRTPADRIVDQPRSVRILLAIAAVAAAAAGVWGLATSILPGVGEPPNDVLSPAELVAGIDAEGDCDSALPSPVGNPVGVRVLIRDPVTLCWVTETRRFEPGEQASFLLVYVNASDMQQDDVLAGLNLAPGFTLVPNSTRLTNERNPSGVQVQSNRLPNGGVRIGDYLPGATALIQFELALPFEVELGCSEHVDYRTVGVIRPDGMNEFYNLVEVELGLSEEC